jgi:hypothetical protein
MDNELFLEDFIKHLQDCLDFYGNVPVALIVEGSETDFVLETARVRYGDSWARELHLMADV